jgi:hypothetical protein
MFYCHFNDHILIKDEDINVDYAPDPREHQEAQGYRTSTRNEKENHPAPSGACCSSLPAVGP